MGIVASRTATISMVTLSALVILSGCADSTGPQDETEEEEYVNPLEPNGNDLIVSQVVLGETGKWTSLWQIAGARTGGYYYRGGYDSYRGGGRLGTTGAVEWHTRTTYRPGDICMAGTMASVPDALIMVGGHDTDGDGKEDVGYISLMSPEGALLNQLLIAPDSAGARLVSIVSASDSTFVAIGGFRDSTGTYPLVVLVTLAADGQLVNLAETAVEDLSGCHSTLATVDTDESSGSRLVLYIDSIAEFTMVHKLSLDLTDLDSCSIEWSREITVPAVEQITVRQLTYSEGNLYWVGSAVDQAKEPPPSDGGYWSSGVVGSLTSAGATRWARHVSASGHSDGFYGVVVTEGALYAMGWCGSFVRQSRYFGYGWITGLASDTGTLQANMILGDHGYRSGFNDGVLAGTTLRSVGWTRQEISGVYQGWFCAVDIASTSARDPVLPPAPARSGDRIAPEDRRLWPPGE